MAVLPLIHDPPAGVPVNVIVAPTHTMPGPEIVAEE